MVGYRAVGSARLNGADGGEDEYGRNAALAAVSGAPLPNKTMITPSEVVWMM